MVEEIINEREKVKINFIKAQAEKLQYLGEFKENVLIALEKSEIEKNIIHPEIIDMMSDPRAEMIKIKREISLRFVKPYIEMAEKLDLRYTLVDDVAFLGNIGLIVVSKEPLDNADKEVVVESIGKIFIDAGLSEGYAFAIGKKICSKHYKMLQEKLPSQVDKFTEMNFLDRLFGKVCPIEIYEKRLKK